MAGLTVKSFYTKDVRHLINYVEYAGSKLEAQTIILRDGTMLEADPDERIDFSRYPDIAAVEVRLKEGKTLRLTPEQYMSSAEEKAGTEREILLVDENGKEQVFDPNELIREMAYDGADDGTGAEEVFDLLKHLDYIENRPGVVKEDGSGLFSLMGPVSAEQAKEKILELEGNRWWVHIISLSREDAQRMGYDNRRSWENLLVSSMPELARIYNISPENLVFYGAYHDKESNPHVHLFMTSERRSEGTVFAGGNDRSAGMKAATERMRSRLFNSVFADDDTIAQLKLRRNEERQQLREQVQQALKTVTRKTYLPDEELCALLQAAAAVQNEEGRAVYGYLPTEQKVVIDDLLVAAVARDGQVGQQFEQLRELQREYISQYNKDPEKIEARMREWEDRFFHPRKGDDTSLHNKILRTVLEYRTQQRIVTGNTRQVKEPVKDAPELPVSDLESQEPERAAVQKEKDGEAEIFYALDQEEPEQEKRPDIDIYRDREIRDVLRDYEKQLSHIVWRFAMQGKNDRGGEVYHALRSLQRQLKLENEKAWYSSQPDEAKKEAGRILRMAAETKGFSRVFQEYLEVVSAAASDKITGPEMPGFLERFKNRYFDPDDPKPAGAHNSVLAVAAKLDEPPKRLSKEESRKVYETLQALYDSDGLFHQYATHLIQLIRENENLTHYVFLPYAEKQEMKKIVTHLCRVDGMLEYVHQNAKQFELGSDYLQKQIFFVARNRNDTQLREHLKELPCVADFRKEFFGALRSIYTSGTVLADEIDRCIGDIQAAIDPDAEFMSYQDYDRETRKKMQTVIRLAIGLDPVLRQKLDDAVSEIYEDHRKRSGIPTAEYYTKLFYNNIFEPEQFTVFQNTVTMFAQNRDRIQMSAYIGINEMLPELRKVFRREAIASMVSGGKDSILNDLTSIGSCISEIKKQKEDDRVYFSELSEQAQETVRRVIGTVKAKEDVASAYDLFIKKQREIVDQRVDPQRADQLMAMLDDPQLDPAANMVLYLAERRNFVLFQEMTKNNPFYRTSGKAVISVLKAAAVHPQSDLFKKMQQLEKLLHKAQGAGFFETLERPAQLKVLEIMQKIGQTPGLDGQLDRFFDEQRTLLSPYMKPEELEDCISWFRDYEHSPFLDSIIFTADGWTKMCFSQQLRQCTSYRAFHSLLYRHWIQLAQTAEGRQRVLDIQNDGEKTNALLREQISADPILQQAFETLKNEYYQNGGSCDFEAMFFSLDEQSGTRYMLDSVAEAVGRGEMDFHTVYATRHLLARVIGGISGIICENAERYYDGRYFPSSRYRRHGRFRTRGRLSGKRQKTEFHNTTIER